MKQYFHSALFFAVFLLATGAFSCSRNSRVTTQPQGCLSTSLPEVRITVHSTRFSEKRWRIFQGAELVFDECQRVSRNAPPFVSLARSKDSEALVFSFQYPVSDEDLPTRLTASFSVVDCAETPEIAIRELVEEPIEFKTVDYGPEGCVVSRKLAELELNTI